VNTGVWHLVNPVGWSTSRLGAEESTRHEATPKVVAFLSNRKPNTAALQSVLGKRLEERGYRVRFYEKESAALAATGALLDRVALDCGRVVNGTGD